MPARMRWRSSSAISPIQRYCSAPSTTSAAARTASEISAATALRLPFMGASLASAFVRKSPLEAGFTFLTNSLRAVDHFEAYDAYIAQRKETQKMKKTIVVLV